jgi:hypothetical protein
MGDGGRRQGFLFLTNRRFLFGPMIEQSLAAPYGHHLITTTIIQREGGKSEPLPLA